MRPYLTRREALSAASAGVGASLAGCTGLIGSDDTARSLEECANRIEGDEKRPSGWFLEEPWEWYGSMTCYLAALRTTWARDPYEFLDEYHARLSTYAIDIVLPGVTDLVGTISRLDAIYGPVEDMKTVVETAETAFQALEEGWELEIVESYRTRWCNQKTNHSPEVFRRLDRKSDAVNVDPGTCGNSITVWFDAILDDALPGLRAAEDKRQKITAIREMIAVVLNGFESFQQPGVRTGIAGVPSGMQEALNTNLRSYVSALRVLDGVLAYDLYAGVTAAPPPDRPSVTGRWPMRSHDPQATGAVTGTRAVGDDPTIAWQVPGDFGGDPVVAKGRVFLGTHDYEGDTLVVLDAATGSLEWTAQTGHRIRETVAVHDDLVVTQSSNGKMIAFGLDDGDREWIRNFEKDLVGNAHLVARNGRVYGGLQRLQAVDAETGEVLGANPGAARVKRISAADGRLFVTDYDGGLYAYDAGTLEELWTYPAENYSLSPATRLVVRDDTLYVGFGELHAIDVATGEQRWTAGEFRPDYGVVGDIAVGHGAVYLRRPHEVHAFEQDTGDVRWARTELPDQEDGFPPAIDEDTVYVNGGVIDDNLLYALDPQTGDRRWALHRPDTGPETGPVLADGWIYLVGSIAGDRYGEACIAITPGT